MGDRSKANSPPSSSSSRPSPPVTAAATTGRGNAMRVLASAAYAAIRAIRLREDLTTERLAFHEPEGETPHVPVSPIYFVGC
jgi:hypothetical protein